MQPTGERVLVKPVEHIEEKKDSILVTPDSTRWTYGEVVAIGKDCKEVLTHDTVIFGAGFGSEIDYKGEKHLIINEEHIVVIIK